MDEHTVLEHLGNLGVILLAVLLSTSVHYLFLKHLNRGARLALKFPQHLAKYRQSCPPAQPTDLQVLEKASKLDVSI